MMYFVFGDSGYYASRWGQYLGWFSAVEDAVKFVESDEFDEQTATIATLDDKKGLEIVKTATIAPSSWDTAGSQSGKEVTWKNHNIATVQEAE